MKDPNDNKKKSFSIERFGSFEIGARVETPSIAIHNFSVLKMPLRHNCTSPVMGGKVEDDNNPEKKDDDDDDDVDKHR